MLRKKINKIWINTDHEAVLLAKRGKRPTCKFVKIPKIWLKERDMSAKFHNLAQNEVFLTFGLARYSDAGRSPVNLPFLHKKRTEGSQLNGLQACKVV
jgi:hypothetical protein